MMFRTPSVAAVAAVSALGGAAAAGLVLPSTPAAPAIPAAAIPIATPVVEVRTQTIHRTVHVIKHLHHEPLPPRAIAPAPAVAPAPAPVAPVARPLHSATSPAPATSRPLRSATSPGGGHGGDDGEHEHEGGGDD
jgi:hypothetical protein